MQNLREKSSTRPTKSVLNRGQCVAICGHYGDIAAKARRCKVEHKDVFRISPQGVLRTDSGKGNPSGGGMNSIYLQTAGKKPTALAVGRNREQQEE